VIKPKEREKKKEKKAFAKNHPDLPIRNGNIIQCGLVIKKQQSSIKSGGRFSEMQT